MCVSVLAFGDTVLMPAPAPRRPTRANIMTISPMTGQFGCVTLGRIVYRPSE